MFIPEYIHNIDEGVLFCERYGISCSVVDNQLNITNPPDLSYRSQFTTMTEVAWKCGFETDHPNCFLTDNGYLLVTFSNYPSNHMKVQNEGCEAEFTEADAKKLRRKGYDIRQCGFDLYGFGTKTYVMAELVSPLDEQPMNRNHATQPRSVSGMYDSERTGETSDDYSINLTLKKEYLLNELNRILFMFGGQFISYRNAADATEEIGRLTKCLEIMYQRKPQEAVETVEAMVEVLGKVETDDDEFPEYNILDLYSAIGQEKSYDEVIEMLGRG